MNQNVIDDLRAFDWQTIIEYGNSLGDLNDAQFRFIKGLAVELCVEKHCNSDLVYIGIKHKDFNWPRHNYSVELKSQLSGGMYGKRGGLNKNYDLKLNNSHGTNKQKTLNPADVADVIVIVRDDGAFAIDRDTAIRYAKPSGDGFEVRVPKSEIVELSGLIVPDRTFDIGLKQKILDAIRDSLP